MNKLKKAVVMVLALAMVLTCAMVTPVQAAGKLNKKSVSIYETDGFTDCERSKIRNLENFR